MRTLPVGRKRAFLITIIVAVLSVASGAVAFHPKSASAQQPPGQNPIDAFRQMQEAAGPIMRANMQAMMEAALAVLARKETADQLAAFSKNYLDALVAKGFSHEDALRLVAAHAPALMPGTR